MTRYERVRNISWLYLRSLLDIIVVILEERSVMRKNNKGEKLHMWDFQNIAGNNCYKGQIAKLINMKAAATDIVGSIKTIK
jgi:hypothetical protein